MNQERRLTFVLLAAAALAVLVAAGVITVFIGRGGGGRPSSQQALPQRVAGELRLFGPDPITFDPALAADVASATYIVEIFSGLVTFDKDLNIVPDIAERWEVSSDGRTYTFRLRRGVLFHDGSRMVTAHDFKYSMERALNPRTGSTVALTYLGDIVGARDFARGRAQEVTGIKVIDDFTLQITIDAPKSYFLAKLTYPTAYVVKREQVEGNPRGWTRQPIGTGPFKLREWRLGERIVLEPNPDYYLEPKPALSRITFLLAGGSPLTMYENGEVDVAPVGINDIERVRDPRDSLNKEMKQVAELATYYVGFNTRRPPFNDPRVRRALAMAIDKDALARVVLREMAVPAKGILPPGIPGHNPDIQGLPFDPQEARKLLMEAGGPEILRDASLLVSGVGGTPGPVIEAIQAMWEQHLGVRPQVQQVEFATFLQQVDRRQFDMMTLGWIADYLDPEDFLDILFHSQSPDNRTGYANPEVDRLLEQARTMPTDTEEARQARLRIYQQAEQIIVQDSPWIPLLHPRSAYVVKPYVQGYFVPPLVMEHLRYVRLER
ncbi:MAG: peptide ABC transporter substrate-binding protein [Dehalococcoidia bacterium]|nr:peptide ABC transporter substrate-binding protein [Dehalococcoidia bacterium]